MTDRAFDVVILGSGLAGQWVALHAGHDARIVVVSKGSIDATNTSRAQGGVAAALSADDSPDAHAADTFVAGGGLCDRDAVRVAVDEGPDQVRALVDLGLELSRDASGRVDLGREGGHHKRRVVHAGDMTGAEIQRVLTEELHRRRGIEVWSHHTALDLLLADEDPTRVVGVLLIDEHGEHVRVHARHVVLATGGIGRVFPHTTNPPWATGDGVAMALRAGAVLRDMEFVQFHPTSLYHPDADGFLLSEALRGEGGIIRNADGVPFVDAIHPLGSLAPRDIVSQAIHAEMQRTGAHCAYLDMREVDPELCRTRFAGIYRRCLELGLDMTRDLLPVVPAAHFACGGVQTDLVGATALEGLMAVGEVASTGLHGANRLASNSLLEALVFGRRVARVIEASLGSEIHEVDAHPPTQLCPAADPAPDRDLVAELHAIMERYCGIVRTPEGLATATELLRELCAVAEARYVAAPSPDTSELRNRITTALLVAASASRRNESRGTHAMVGYPTASVAEHTTVTRDEV